MRVEGRGHRAQRAYRLVMDLSGIRGGGSRRGSWTGRSESSSRRPASACSRRPSPTRPPTHLPASPTYPPLLPTRPPAADPPLSHAPGTPPPPACLPAYPPPPAVSQARRHGACDARAGRPCRPCGCGAQSRAEQPLGTGRLRVCSRSAAWRSCDVCVFVCASVNACMSACVQSSSYFAEWPCVVRVHACACACALVRARVCARVDARGRACAQSSSYMAERLEAIDAILIPCLDLARRSPPTHKPARVQAHPHAPARKQILHRWAPLAVSPAARLGAAATDAAGARLRASVRHARAHTHTHTMHIMTLASAMAAVARAGSRRKARRKMRRHGHEKQC